MTLHKYGCTSDIVRRSRHSVSPSCFAFFITTFLIRVKAILIEIQVIKILKVENIWMSRFKASWFPGCLGNRDWFSSIIAWRDFGLQNRLPAFSCEHINTFMTHPAVSRHLGNQACKEDLNLSNSGKQGFLHSCPDVHCLNLQIKLAEYWAILERSQIHREETEYSEEKSPLSLLRSVKIALNSTCEQ